MKTSNRFRRHRVIPLLVLALPLGALLRHGVAAAGEPGTGAIPFPEALSRSRIEVETLESPMEHALILGNGDVNALLWAEGGDLTLTLTKNDVWDARLDTAGDPPLPTLARILELGRSGGAIGDPILPEGVTWSGPDSYHSHPYPCPRACARLRISGADPRPFWRRIRAEGSDNSFGREEGAAVMRIAGRPGASNGYACGPLKVVTAERSKLRIRLSGSENARYYIDLMGPSGEPVFASRWIESPTMPEDRAFDLPAGKTVRTIILYTWTEDGRPAENRFERAAFEGSGGSIDVDLEALGLPARRAALDLRRAVAEVEAGGDGLPAATIRALAQANVLLLESRGSVTLIPIESRDLPAATSGEREGVRWLHQVIPGDLDWPGMSFAVALAGRGTWKASAVVTSRESRDPVAAAVALAGSTAGATPSDLIGEHEAAWDSLWARSGVELGDKLLESTWYRSIYFLRCVTKPGAVSPGLFAGLVDDAPAWHGDYHTNYNIQQTFWPAYPANHPELAEPYDRLVLEYLPRAKWLARRIFDLEGAYYPHVLFAYEPPDPDTVKNRIGREYFHHTWGMTLGVAGFTAQPLWWHYKYDPSPALLRDTVYPVLSQVAIFYAAFVERCEGGEKVVLGPSVSPEHWGWTPRFERNRNCAFDIAMVRYTLEAAIEAAGTLGRDPDLAARWRKALDRLPPYPLHGGEQPVVVDVEGAPPIEYNISVPATPVFPGDVVTFLSPAAERDLFARTIEGLRWNGNNSMVMLAVSRARLGMPGTQEWLRREVEARLRPNGTLTLNRLSPHHSFNDFGHYTEQFGALFAISELLVQSVGDVVRILPALSKGSRASFSGLRTQGGFLVSSEGTAGEIGAVKITSTAGGRLRIQSPWRTLQVLRRPSGERLDADPDSGGFLTFQTRPGETLELLPAGPL